MHHWWEKEICENISTSPEAGDVNMTAQEGCVHLANTYLNQCSKEQDDCAPQLRHNHDFHDLIPLESGQKLRKIDPEGVSSVQLYQYNSCLKYLKHYSPVWRTIRGFIPHHPG